MQLHTIQANTALRRGKRIGRGGKRGTTSGRGTKGQKARAGHKIRPSIRDILKKIPKRRGRGKHTFRPFRVKPLALTLFAIAAKFREGEVVDAGALLRAGLIHKMKGRVPAVKILGNAPVGKRLEFRGLQLSTAARAAVDAAGGEVLSASVSHEAKRRQA